MFINRYTQPTLAAILISSLSACSSGGGGDSAAGATEVTSSGAITGFGSVILNSSRFDTAGSRIVSEDDGRVLAENPSDDELKQVLGLGEVVTVRGTRIDDSNGVANTISVDDELVGEVTSVDAAVGSFVANAQTVSITPDTIIDDSMIEAAGFNVPNDMRYGDVRASLGIDLSNLLTANTGMIVEVNGFPSQNGVEATRVEDVSGQAAPGGGELDDEVKGFVSQLNPGVSFKINDLTVSYDIGALDSEDFAGRDLAENDFVEVHGEMMGAASMNAFRIELDDDVTDDELDSGDLEIEGMITKVTKDDVGTGGVIVINGDTIRVDDVSMFSEGLRVEFEGTVLRDGSVLVSQIKDESEDTIRTEDEVASSVPGTSFTTRLGITITPSDRSRLEDDTIDDDDGLTIQQFLSNIDGKRIEARGFPLDGVATWTRLEIEDSSDPGCRLRGPVETVDDQNFNSFTIMGVTIDVSNVSENNFEGSNDQPIGRQMFFDQLIAQLSQGVIVQATSDSDAANNGCSNLNMTAREVEFEPADDVLFDDGGNNDGVNDNEITGAVTEVAVDGTSFVAGGETITVTVNTLIDSSIIEAATGLEIANDLPYGDLNETLADLLPIGLNVVVGVDRSSGVVALIIEDI